LGPEEGGAAEEGSRGGLQGNAVASQAKGGGGQAAGSAGCGVCVASNHLGNGGRSVELQHGVKPARQCGSK